MERDVGEVGPGELGLVARDRLGDAACLVVEDEREQIAAGFAAAISVLVDEDAEPPLPMGTPNGIENSRGTPPALGDSLISHQ